MKDIAQQTGMYLKAEVRKHVTLESRFLLYLPEGYDPQGRQWPLLLFLHGSGETGDMLDMVKKHGPPKMIEHGYKFPFIVISPQCPEDQVWSAVGGRRSAVSGRRSAVSGRQSAVGGRQPLKVMLFS